MVDTESLGAMFLQQSGELTGIQVVTIVGHKGIIGGRQLLWRQVAVAKMALGTHGVDKTDPVFLILPVACQDQLTIASRDT